MASRGGLDILRHKKEGVGTDNRAISDSESHGAILQALQAGKERGGFCRYPVRVRCA
jgi:hypothetical protein